MSASVYFVARSRRGVGAGTRAGVVGSRRLVQETVSLRADRPGQPQQVRDIVSAPLAVLGPADVTGLDPGQIVRRSPRPGEYQLEPNYLAGIEFAHPDLPWIFSAAAPVSPTHAQPWLMLVVIRTDGGSGPPEGRLAAMPGSPNPVLEVTEPDALPDPADAWAWAHIQVHGDATPIDQVANQLRTDPQRPTVRSRLLCPTRLEPDAGYSCCVVPVFEAGRLVGLGRPEGSAGVGLWTAAAGLQLPVYDSWTFRTGPSGDFETLARRLSPLPDAQARSIGYRTVAVEARAALMQHADDPNPDLFTASVQPVPTAIANPGRATAALSAGQTAGPALALHRRLKELLDIVSTASDAVPVVGPPLYGRWHAQVTDLDGGQTGPDLGPVPPNSRQTWIEQLNADPYQRIAAAVGTRSVQHDQDALMTDAWSQLSTLVEANLRVRWVGLFAGTSQVVYDRLSAAVAPIAARGRIGAVALRLAAPALGRLPATTGPDHTTVHAELERSNVAPAILSAAFVKATRYAARAARPDRQVSSAEVVSSAVSAAANGAATVVPGRLVNSPIPRAATMAQILSDPALADRVRAGLGTDAATYLARIQAVPDTLRQLAANVSALDIPAAVDPVADVRTGVRHALLLACVQALSVATQNPSNLIGPSGVQAPTAVGAAPKLPTFAVLDPSSVTAVLTALDPRPAYERLLRFAHSDPDPRVRQRTPFHPVMAAPQFDEPFATRLSRIDAEWVLGGVGSLPNNTIGLLEMNPEFVESCLAGANHEMARELLWRGYPTDLRGTCFDRFWPGNDADIAPMDSWIGDLGQHPVRGTRAALVVVVIKGDLLRRFPSVLICAQRGRTTIDAGSGTFTPDVPTGPSDPVVATELFRGRLGEDVTYSALAMSAAVLRTVDPADDRHGWYISLLEPYDEPRFGLDDAPGAAAGTNQDGQPDSWSWQGLAVPDPAHLTPGLLFDHDSSAVTASNLFQKPFRLLLRAADYLPAG